MLFGKRSANPHAVSIVRDVVEVVAIIAAGAWAFYVFAYENRIKPSFANPDIDVTASIQRLGVKDGLMAVGVRMELRNIGTVDAHFLGVALNVYGQRVTMRPAKRGTVRHPHPGVYEYDAFYHLDEPQPVYSYAYVTHLGDPSSNQDTELAPGTSLENYRTFYIPAGKFDVLTVGVDVPFSKFEGRTIPTHLSVNPKGDVLVIPPNSPDVNLYNILPVTTLDVR